MLVADKHGKRGGKVEINLNETKQYIIHLSLN
jgi:hypothetical protein